MKRRAIALTVLLVASILAGPISLAGGAAATGGPPGGMVGVPDGNVGPPDHAAGDGLSTSSGPPEQTLENIPTDAAAWSVHASEHADDLEVTVGADSTGLELVVSDDRNHEGREIAVDAATLEEAAGRRPSTAYGLHESGDRWTSEIEYEDGYATFEVPHFSTNQVTFSGEVQVSAQPAEDGSKITYDLGDADNFSDPVVNVTGVENTEQESESRSLLSDGSTVNFSVAGNAAPKNGEVTLSAQSSQETTTAVSSTTAGPTGNSHTVNLDSDYDPQATINVNNFGAKKWEEGLSETHTYQVPDGVEITEVSLSVYEDSSSLDGETFSLYIDGTEVLSFTHDSSYGNSETASVSIVSDGDLEASVQSSTSDYNFDGHYVKTATASSADVSDASGTSTISSTGDTTLSVSNGDNAISVTPDTGTVSYNISKTEKSGAKDPSVSIDGQTVSYSGTLNGSTTETVDLSTGSKSVPVSLSGGQVNLSVDWTERTETVDPAIELNGNTTTLYSGTLSSGTTSSTTLSSAALKSGTNRINVSVGDGSLSTDAPPPKVDLSYSHAANTSVSVDYAAESWQERYNVSKTWPDDVTDAQLQLSMASDRVIAVGDLRVYDGSGTEVTYRSWDYQDGTLTVSLGDLSADTTRRVVVNGTKVRVPSGEISVTDPTIEGNKLSTGIRVDQTPPDGPVEIELGGTVDDDRIHRVTSSSWSANERALVTADGDQTLELPDAPADGTATIERAPLTVTPDTGDARVSVSGPMTEPTIEVSPGQSSGDSVSFTFVDAADGQRYELLSKTNNVVRDSGTANSPLTLTDDDSEETLQFYIPESSATSDGGGGVIGPIEQPQSWLEPLQVPLSLLAGALVLLMLWLAWRQGPTAAVSTVGGAGASAGRGVAAGLTGVVDWLRRHPTVSAVLISGLGILGVGFGLVPVPEGGGTFLLITAVPIVAYLTLIRWLEASLLTWVAVTLVASVLGLQLLGTDVLGTLVNSEAFPLVVIGALYLAYQGLQAYRAEEETPETVNRIEFDADDSSSSGSGDSA